MESCLLQILNTMNEHEVSNIIHAFGHMGCAWATVSPALQAAFQNAVVKKVLTMQPQGVSITLHGLANMDAKWTNLMPEMRKKTEQAVITILQEQRDIAHEMAISIHSLGKMAPWKTLPAEFQAAVLDAFNLLQDKLTPQDISNFIYG